MSEDFERADASRAGDGEDFEAAHASGAGDAARDVGQATPGENEPAVASSKVAGAAAAAADATSSIDRLSDALDAVPAGSGAGTTANAGRGRKGRIVFFVLMALLMQLAFALSYTGAMHAPQKPHRMAVGIVAPDSVAAEVQKAFDAQGPLFSIKPEKGVADAEQAIKDHKVFGAYAPDLTGGSQDVLYVTTALGPPVPQALYSAFGRIAQAQQHTMTLRDVVPAHKGDNEGLVPFYLVIAWTVGGYLASALVGLMGGMTSRTPRLAAVRIGLLAGYSVLGGLGGTLIVHTILGFLGGNWWVQALIGSLVVFSVAVFANGLQSVLGLVGTGIAIGMFVILGNPSGAGPWPREMMPTFWRVIGPWLPNFQGVNAVRGVAYFGGQGVGSALWVLGAYAVVGIALSVAFAGRDNAVLRLSEH
jgi:hypothetical protein